MSFIGLCYFYGYGVLMNENEAIRWFKRSAEQGNYQAKQKLFELEINI